MKPIVFAGLVIGGLALEIAYRNTRDAQAQGPETRPHGAGSASGFDRLPQGGRRGGERNRQAEGPGGPGGPGGFGGPGMGPGGIGRPGGPGVFGGVTRELIAQFDQDGNGWLNKEERQAARKVAQQGGGGRGGPRFGGGRPDPSEFLVGPAFAALDSDGAGGVSADELAAGIRKLVQRAAGESRPITPAELGEALEAIVPRPDFGPGGFGPGGGGPEGPGRDGPAGAPGQQERGPMGGRGPGRGFGPVFALAGAVARDADRNQDELLTPDELQQAGRVLFQKGDQDHDGRWTAAEMKTALGSLLASVSFGGPGGGPREKGRPGPKVEPSQVRNYGDEPLYAPEVLRTLFLTFENDDWEKELEDFHGTDVEVPATLEVDGRTYPNVGVHFRGMSSYGGVPAGSKRSLNVALDLADGKQRLMGQKTLNLLNAHEDSSFLSSILYSHIARKHIPAPKANLVKVVINGESWGVYVNVQQFNKDFVRENYGGDGGGARWKVSGSPGGGGGLEYLGDNIDDYRRRYEIKSSDNNKSWKRLIEFCRVLNETPADQLEAAITPLLDVEGALWFLALDVALINNDGYWVRASDYSLYLDGAGKLHFIPHDMNEAFRPAMMMGMGGPGMGGPGGPGGFGGPGGPRFGGRGFGPGGRGGNGPGGNEEGRGRRPMAEGEEPRGPRGNAQGGRGLELDPLVALDDPRKPVRSKLLAVPKFRERYLEMVRTIAREDMDWETIGPVVAPYRTLMSAEVQADTRKLSSFEAFEAAVASRPAGSVAPTEAPGREISLQAFFEGRRAFLLR